MTPCRATGVRKHQEEVYFYFWTYIVHFCLCHSSAIAALKLCIIFKLPDSALSWNFSLSENVASLILQDRATTWHYFHQEPATQPSAYLTYMTIKYPQILSDLLP
jgi:hypothetical protein